MERLRSIWSNENQRNITIGILVVIAAVIIWFFVIKKEKTVAPAPSSSATPVNAAAPPADTLPIGPIVVHKKDYSVNSDAQIAYYVKDWNQLFNTDLAYVDLFTKTPIMKYPNVKFNRPSSAGTEGSILYVGYNMPKEGKWIDKPIADDLAIALPISDTKRIYYRTTGDLVFRFSTGLKTIFRKDSEGYITVVDGFYVNDNDQIEEDTFRLAKLVNFQ